MAGAYEALKYVQKNQKTLERDIKAKGAHIMKRLEEMKEQLRDRRRRTGGLGLMIGVELVKDKKSKAYATKERDEILRIALDKGLLLLPSGESTIRILPPLTISKGSHRQGAGHTGKRHQEGGTRTHQIAIISCCSFILT